MYKHNSELTLLKGELTKTSTYLLSVRTVLVCCVAVFTTGCPISHSTRYSRRERTEKSSHGQFKVTAANANTVFTIMNSDRFA